MTVLQQTAEDEGTSVKHALCCVVLPQVKQCNQAPKMLCPVRKHKLVVRRLVKCNFSQLHKHFV